KMGTGTASCRASPHFFRPVLRRSIAKTGVPGHRNEGRKGRQLVLRTISLSKRAASPFSLQNELRPLSPAVLEWLAFAAGCAPFLPCSQRGVALQSLQGLLNIGRDTFAFLVDRHALRD